MSVAAVAVHDQDGRGASAHLTGYLSGQSGALVRLDGSLGVWHAELVQDGRDILGGFAMAGASNEDSAGSFATTDARVRWACEGRDRESRRGRRSRDLVDLRKCDEQVIATVTLQDTRKQAIGLGDPQAFRRQLRLDVQLPLEQVLCVLGSRQWLTVQHLVEASEHVGFQRGFPESTPPLVSILRSYRRLASRRYSDRMVVISALGQSVLRGGVETHREAAAGWSGIQSPGKQRPVEGQARVGFLYGPRDGERVLQRVDRIRTDHASPLAGLVT